MVVIQLILCAIPYKERYAIVKGCLCGFMYMFLFLFLLWVFMLEKGVIKLQCSRQGIGGIRRDFLLW